MELPCKDQIIVEIYRYLETMGGDATKWFVGVTRDAERQLFEVHNVDRAADRWIWRVSQSAAEAREVERFFVETVGTDGEVDGVTGEGRTVYAFRRSSRTRR
ncbi:MAG: hypothetical protein KC503_23450 [Myxococcales bacterium]|nr:hypothetical protein [Myxococcales bacterium]